MHLIHYRTSVIETQAKILKKLQMSQVSKFKSHIIFVCERKFLLI